MFTDIALTQPHSPIHKQIKVHGETLHLVSQFNEECKCTIEQNRCIREEEFVSFVAQISHFVVGQLDANSKSFAHIKIMAWYQNNLFI